MLDRARKHKEEEEAMVDRARQRLKYPRPWGFEIELSAASHPEPGEVEADPANETVMTDSLD